MTKRLLVLWREKSEKSEKSEKKKKKVKKPITKLIIVFKFFKCIYFLSDLIFLAKKISKIEF
jgi:hypothetical protein